ncbi:hypothetical protein [Dysgonomonas capnocytophagoides]|uniref:hypothetical protein n=1 Tax=Dysgonomonas capnocytophagoides TaxID=45254 RepID=UPI003342018D
MNIDTRKYKLKKNLLFRGGIFFIVMFLLTLVDSSIQKSLVVTLIFWLLLVLIFSIVIIKEEYIEPRRKLKHLNKRKYDFLYQNGFKRTEQLTIKGIYKEFIIIVHPKEMERLKRKNIRFDIIEILYQFGEGELRDYSKAENEMSGLYHVGNVEFIEGSAYFIPPQYTEPKFEEILFDLISIMKREDLKPRIE